MNLAKVGGSPQYVALMEELIRKPQTPSWRSYPATIGQYLAIWRFLKRSVGLARWESAVLAEMMAELKSESEMALRTNIQTVAVTAPWMAAWDSQIPDDSVINTALVLAGLEPIEWGANEPIYLGEINTVLAANNRELCKEHWCGSTGDTDWNAFVYFIRLVVWCGLWYL